MIEVLLAATIVTVGGPPQKTTACNADILQTSAEPALLMRPRDWPQAHTRKLGDLPKAKAELAVMRKVDGCMVAVPARYRMPEQ